MRKFSDNITRKFNDFLFEKEFNIDDEGLTFKSSQENNILMFNISCTYEKKQNIYNTSCNFNFQFFIINSFFEDCLESDVFLFYDSDTRQINLISGFGLYYLQIKYGEDKYPSGIYNYFTKEQVEEIPEIVLNYLEKEYYEKCFLDIEEQYGSIAKADKTINDEILSNGFVKKHNINWADFDNQCIRSILFAHFNNNPNISKLVEICNKTMIEEKLNNPKNSRIPLYNFILNKIGFDYI